MPAMDEARWFGSRQRRGALGGAVYRRRGYGRCNQHCRQSGGVAGGAVNSTVNAAGATRAQSAA